MELASLHIHQIDLHYHAGQERHKETSLEDYLIHAHVTGRRVLGLTDHLGLFWPPRKEREGLPYEQSLDGLRHYAEDVEAAREAFSDLKLFFAPELSPWLEMAETPDEVVELADFFICEYASAGDDTAENTASFVNRLYEVREFVDATGVPAFIAHPFRAAVNFRLVKREIEPWVTALEPRPDGSFSRDELDHFFSLDLAAVGRACRETGIPLDINGGTQNRVRSSNLPACLQMLWAAFAYLRDAGAAFVPGSDQHGYRAGVGRMGRAVPWDCCNYLGLEAGDISFLDGLL